MLTLLTINYYKCDNWAECVNRQLSAVAERASVGTVVRARDKQSQQLSK